MCPLCPNERDMVMQQSQQVAADREPPNGDEWRSRGIPLKCHSLSHAARGEVLVVKTGEAHLCRSSIAQFAFDRRLCERPEMMKHDDCSDDERQQHRPADGEALADP